VMGKSPMEYQREVRGGVHGEMRGGVHGEMRGGVDYLSML